MGYSYPFESQNTGTAQEPVYDRAITAEMERAFNKLKYTNGVFASPVNSLMVEATGGMGIKVNPGGACIEGAIFNENNARAITIGPSSATLSRIDRIVLRLDLSTPVRSIDIYKKEGVHSTTPVAPDIVQQPNYYEIVLADVVIPKGASTITNSNITDQRLNPSLCGLVVPAIPAEQPVNELWQQISNSISLVNSALDETVAGNLQNQITALSTELTNEKKARIQERIGIGGIYIGTTSANPSTILGYGTWVRFAEGRMLIGAGTSDKNYPAGETGGQSPPTMPAHVTSSPTAALVPGTYQVSVRPAVSTTSGGGTHRFPALGVDGVGDANKGNLPPYITTYIWRRTA